MTKMAREGASMVPRAWEEGQQLANVQEKEGEGVSA